MEYLRLTWRDVDRQGKVLASRLDEEDYDPDCLIGIARGGWIPARILSDLLGKDDVSSLRVKFYKAIGETGAKPEIVEGVQRDISGKRTLIVDDIADTGESLLAALDHIREKGAEEVRIATLMKKPHSKLTPDFFAEETSAWVIFPWEVQETIKNIAQRFGTPEDAVKELEKAGIEKSEYEDALKG